MHILCLNIFILVLASEIKSSCNTEHEDNNNAIINPPRGSTRVCSVVLTSNGVNRLFWVHGNTGCSRENYVDECLGYVGMNLIFQCQFDVTGIYKAEGDRVGNSSVSFDTLQPKDAGEYECRARNGIRYVYNITVSADEVSIGVDPILFCNFIFSYNATYDCFENNNPISITDFSVPRKFYMFGTRNVTVRSEWLAPQYHYPTDIGLQVMNDDPNTTQFMLRIANHPRRINNVNSKVLAIVSASNSISHHSICVHLQFEGTTNIFTNVSLPLDADVFEGEEAIFECKIGTSEAFSNDFYFFQYSNFSVDSNMLTSVWTKFSDRRSCNDVTINDEQHYQFTCSLEEYQYGSRYMLTYTFHVFNVTIEDHGSIFSCTVFDNHGNIQWKNTANLNVIMYKILTSMTTDLNIHETREYTYIIIAILPPVLVLTLISIVGYKWRKIRKKAEVPKTNLELMPKSEPERTILVVSEDHVVSLSHEMIFHSSGPVDDINTRYKMNTDYSPSNIHTESDAHRTDSDPELISSSSLWTLKCIVYISYTDTKARWVRNYLKPLIESCDYCEVRLHEDHMIPGFTISGERQRLILEARKVILVVSTDYSESDWCLYELQHAIQQEPAMCYGRVIPIMVDGCQTLPSIVEGVVSLKDDDNDFETKLMKNINNNDS